MTLTVSAAIGAVSGAFFFRKSILLIKDGEKNNSIVTVGIILVNPGMGVALLVKEKYETHP